MFIAGETHRYSTVYIDFNPIQNIHVMFGELVLEIEQMEQKDIKTNQGRKKSDMPMPEYFEEVYWAFENYFIDEKAALSNQFFSIPKRRFYDFCETYERSERYVEAQNYNEKKLFY